MKCNQSAEINHFKLVRDRMYSSLTSASIQSLPRLENAQGLKKNDWKWSCLSKKQLPWTLLFSPLQMKSHIHLPSSNPKRCDQLVPFYSRVKIKKPNKPKQDFVCSRLTEIHCIHMEQHFCAAPQCRVTCFTRILQLNVSSGALLKAPA